MALPAGRAQLQSRRAFLAGRLVARHIADNNFDAHAAALECYGEYLGLQAGTLGSGLRETPTAEGMLHGVFVVVTCSTAMHSTTVTGVAHHTPGEAVVERREPVFAQVEQAEADQDVDARFAREFTVQSDSPDTAMWLTPALRRQLTTMPISEVRLALSGKRFVLTLGGVHATNVALLDRALGVILTAVLGRPVGPIQTASTGGIK